MCQTLTKIFWQVLRFNQFSIQQRWRDVADDTRRGECAAVTQGHALYLALMYLDLADFGIDEQTDAARLAFTRHRLRNSAHAANGVPPGTGLAIDLPKHVVQQDIGRARAVGRSKIAYDRIPAQCRLQWVAFKPAIEQIAR